MDKNKKLEQHTFEGKILPLIIGFFLIFWGALMVICHPQIGYSIYVLILIGIGIVLIGFGSLVLFIADIWFIGKKFDSTYREEILCCYKAGNKKKQYPIPYFMSGFSFYRTMMYSRAIIMPKLSKRKSIFKESLKSNATNLDIFFAWTINVLICLGFVLLIFATVLRYLWK